MINTLWLLIHQKLVCVCEESTLMIIIVKTGYHHQVLLSIKGLQGHMCNRCRITISGIAYRSDITDYDLCLKCVKNDDFEENWKKFFPQLTQKRLNLLELKEKNDIRSLFKIEPGKKLEKQELEMQYRKLNRNLDKEADTDGNFGKRNLIKESYIQDVEDWSQLLSLYESHENTHRVIYNQIENAGDLIENLYKHASQEKQQLVELLSEDKNGGNPSNHLLFKEISLYCECLKIQ